MTRTDPTATQPTGPGTSRTINRKVAVMLFLSLLGFWYLLSDQYTTTFAVLGIASSALVTWVTAPLVAGVVGQVPHPLSQLPVQFLRFGQYVVWVLWRIVVSAGQVAWIVVNPRVPPEPSMLRFTTSLRSPLARVVYANTISLVPGTLTVQLDGDELLVHALVPDAAADLLDGRMERRIAGIFLEEGVPAIDPTWEPPPVLVVHDGGPTGPEATP
jgi:multicomponent Na+:H+ antiporter subunit E